MTQQEFIGPAHPNYQGPRAAHDDGRVCRCVSEHRPAPLELERHHVWPLGMGGPEDDWNVEWVCPTTHTNAHELLRAMMRQDRPIPLEEFSREYPQPVSRWAHHLAVVGYLRWKNRDEVPLRVKYAGEGL